MRVERSHGGGRAVVLVALLAILGALVTPRAAVAQAPPEAVLIAAAERLEASGYTAQLRWAGEYAVTGELRYASPSAFATLLEDQDGGGFEYIVLDSRLYNRNRPNGAADWGAWQRREWRTDQVVAANLVQYDPRLPLALLRGATNPVSLGIERSEGRLVASIGARVNFTAAIAAVYDLPRDGLGAIDLSTWPLTVRLDAETGDAIEITLDVPATADRTGSAATFTFDVPEMAPELRAPADAVEVAGDTPMTRAGPRPPEEPVRALPLTLSGEGRQITFPWFRLESGPLRVRIEPRVAELQTQLWRIVDGRPQLVILTASIGAIDDIIFAADLPPGDYWLELILPEPARWTATLETLPAGAESPP